MRSTVSRRHILSSGGAALSLSLLSACAVTPVASPRRSFNLPPLRIAADLITRVTVCSRPFRPEGPRIERVALGAKALVHHYGHGGSGWSLSWGSAQVAADLVMQGGRPAEVAVIGSGAIGLTTALVLQRMGLPVTIYARELPPDTASTFATGVWSPDSRIALDQHATPEFKARWQSMCRHSFDRYQSMLGLPGTPVEWYDNYALRPTTDSPPGPDDPRPEFAGLMRELVPEQLGGRVNFEPGQHPFGPLRARRIPSIMFNLPAYTKLLVDEFLLRGGRMQVREFHSPAELLSLPQPMLVNCTGIGAATLFGDQSLVPIRGQLVRLPPQADIHYGLYFNRVSFVPRRDGMVFQHIGEGGDYYGYGDPSLAPDRPLAEECVNRIAGLFAPMA